MCRSRHSCVKYLLHHSSVTHCYTIAVTHFRKFEGKAFDTILLTQCAGYIFLVITQCAGYIFWHIYLILRLLYYYYKLINVYGIVAYHLITISVQGITQFCKCGTGNRKIFHFTLLLYFVIITMT